MKTGTENLLPQWNLFDAVAFCTGGAFRPPFSTKWTDTDTFLRENEYTGMEYAMYLMHFSELREKGKSVFTATNFIGSPRVWALFVEWKEKRPKEVKQLCVRQRQKYKNFTSTGYPVDRVLMDNMAELASPVLVEVALQKRRKTHRTGANTIW